MSQTHNNTVKNCRPGRVPRPKMALQAGPGGLGQVWAQTLKNLRKTTVFRSTLQNT